MTLATYLDIDRNRNAYVLTVSHTFNKKGEPVDTIRTVKHLGKWTVGSMVLDRRQLPIWPRCKESGDYDKFIGIVSK